MYVCVWGGMRDAMHVHHTTLRKEKIFIWEMQQSAET